MTQKQKKARQSGQFSWPKRCPRCRFIGTNTTALHEHYEKNPSHRPDPGTPGAQPVEPLKNTEGEVAPRGSKKKDRPADSIPPMEGARTDHEGLPLTRPKRLAMIVAALADAQEHSLEIAERITDFQVMEIDVAAERALCALALKVEHAVLEAEGLLSEMEETFGGGLIQDEDED
jgi:hypothetical protein